MFLSEETLAIFHPCRPPLTIWLSYYISVMVAPPPYCWYWPRWLPCPRCCGWSPYWPRPQYFLSETQRSPPAGWNGIYHQHPSRWPSSRLAHRLFGWEKKTINWLIACIYYTCIYLVCGNNMCVSTCEVEFVLRELLRFGKKKLSCFFNYYPRGWCRKEAGTTTLAYRIVINCTAGSQFLNWSDCV